MFISLDGTNSIRVYDREKAVSAPQQSLTAADGDVQLDWVTVPLTDATTTGSRERVLGAGTRPHGTGLAVYWRPGQAPEYIPLDEPPAAKPAVEGGGTRAWIVLGSGGHLELAMLDLVGGVATYVPFGPSGNETDSGTSPSVPVPTAGGGVLVAWRGCVFYAPAASSEATCWFRSDMDIQGAPAVDQQDRQVYVADRNGAVYRVPAP